MARVADLLSAYENAESLTQAEHVLGQLAAVELPNHLRLGDLYDGLAEAAADTEDFSLAIRAQRRAIEIGCEHPEIAREMLAWYLLKDGRREEGEAAFAKLRGQRGEDPEILLTLANARMDSGDGRGASEAFDEALEAAKRATDDAWVDQIRSERRYCRYELGLDPDDEDRLAEMVKPVDSETPTRWSIAWFPRDQVQTALGRWPALADDLNDPDAYCRSIEGTLREVSASTGRRPSVAPLDVERLVNYAEEHGLDPESGAARSRFAAELDRRGESVEWPPGRNEPCWCGSGRKYKRCCERGAGARRDPA